MTTAVGCKQRNVPGPAPAAVGVAAQEAALRRRIREAPRDPRPRLALVDFLLDVRRNGDALEEARAASRAFPNSAVATESLAEALLATARTREAISLLRPLAPDSEEYRVELARALVRDGQPEAATEALSPLENRVRSLTPALALRTALVYLDTRHPERAVPFLQAAAQADPSQLDPHTYLGYAQLTSGRYAAAAATLEHAIELSPNLPVLHYYRGCALRLSGDLNALPDAQAELHQAAEATPDSGLYAYELGLSCAQLRQWDDVEKNLERAASLASDVPEIQRDLARAYRHRGRRVQEAMAQARYLRLVDDAPSAVRVLEPWYRKDPTNVDLALEMSVADHAASASGKAREVLETVRKREPANPRILWSLYRLQIAVRHYGEAETVLNELDRLVPNDVMVMDEREKLYEALSRHTEAEALLIRLRDREPNDPFRLYALARHTALWSQRPDRVALAEASLRKALELRPDYPSALYELGNLLDGAGRPREAVAYLRRAVDLEPAFGDALRALGKIDLELGDRKRAEEDLRQYRDVKARADRRSALQLPVDQQRDLPKSRAALAQVELRSGDYNAAIHQLECLEHASPGDAAVHRLLGDLYGQTRRFQRQFEERRWSSGSR